MLKLWSKKKLRASDSQSQYWDLGSHVLQLSGRDMLTVGDVCMGTIVLGATGTGKTTGPGAALTLSFLRRGFGGLVLCVKPGERETWQRYSEKTGRSSDLVIFDSSGKERFCFLQEEMTRAGAGAGLTESVVNLLSSILEVAERNSGQGGREDEGYWRRANRQLVRSTVDLLVFAKGEVRVPDLYRLVISAPMSREQLADETWKGQSFCFQCLKAADAAPKTSRQQCDFELVADYFMIEWPTLSEKTRSVVMSTFTSMVDVLNRSLLRELFSTNTTVRPEDTLDGKIIVVDLPVKEFAEIGTFSGVLWKHCWQKAVERRDLSVNQRPVFLFADEFQYFCVQHDQQFQTTARSARAATVYLTQNVSNLLAAFGGSDGKAMTDSILGNLQTKIWCANGDPETNDLAARTIGRTSRYFINCSQTPQEFNIFNASTWSGGSRVTAGMSEQLEFDCDPRVFTQLRTGGPPHWTVDAILFQAGRQFAASGKSWRPVSFRQEF